MRNRVGRGTLGQGELGVVTSPELRGRHRLYTVAFERVDLLTRLPLPEEMELVAPPT